MTQSLNLNINRIDMFATKNNGDILARNVNDIIDFNTVNEELNSNKSSSELIITPDSKVLNSENENVFLVLSYTLEK